MTTQNLWPSPNEKCKNPFTSESYLNGRKLIERTAEWIGKNTSDFIAIYNYVKDLQASGFRGRVRDRVIAEGMVHGLKFAEDGYTFANDLWAGIARYLVVLDPSLMGSPIEFRQSDIDGYGLVPIDFPEVKGARNGR